MSSNRVRLHLCQLVHSLAASNCQEMDCGRSVANLERLSQAQDRQLHSISDRDQDPRVREHLTTPLTHPRSLVVTTESAADPIVFLSGERLSE
jgi:hypothetical protein